MNQFNINNSTIGGVVMLIVGFAMGHMSAELFQINAWLLSTFVAGLGLALGYVARERAGAEQEPS